MKQFSTHIGNPVQLGKFYPGAIFIWDDKLCTFFNKGLQYIAGSGEKLRLPPTTLVYPIGYEISVDGVRSWIRASIRYDRQAKKEISPLETLILINEETEN